MWVIIKVEKVFLKSESSVKWSYLEVINIRNDLSVLWSAAIISGIFIYLKEFVAFKAEATNSSVKMAEYSK